MKYLESLKAKLEHLEVGMMTHLYEDEARKILALLSAAKEYLKEDDDPLGPAEALDAAKDDLLNAIHAMET